MNNQALKKRNVRWLAGLLVVVLAASGCGSKTGTVTGTVRYRNHMLTTGTVSFYCEKGEIVSALISPEGTYHLPRVPKGPARVAVVSHPAVPPGLQANRVPLAFARPATPQATLPIKPYTLIPERYNRPDSSGLVLTVHPGEQTLDLDLAP